MIDFISETGDSLYPWTFSSQLAAEAFKEGSITRKQKKIFLEAAHYRSDVAASYLHLYKDEISDSERQVLFDSLLNGRDHALWFMKKKDYTEEERLKFQSKLSTMPLVFFKYLKQFPDLLRDNEKDAFFNEHRKTLITKVFRNNFNELLSIFKDQLTHNEIENIVDQMLRLKGKRGKFLNELLKYIEANNITIEKEKEELLLSYMMIDMLIGE